MSELNGIPLSKRSARLMFLPVDHLMSGTLMACPWYRVPAHYVDEYYEDVWSPEKAAAAFKSQIYWPMQTMLKSQAIFNNCAT